MIAVRLHAQTYRGSYRFSVAGSTQRGAKRTPGWRQRLGAFWRVV